MFKEVFIVPQVGKKFVLLALLIRDKMSEEFFVVPQVSKKPSRLFLACTFSLRQIIQSKKHQSY
jgi:hypothetical protein